MGSRSDRRVRVRVADSGEDPTGGKIAQNGRGFARGAAGESSSM